MEHEYTDKETGLGFKGFPAKPFKGQGEVHLVGWSFPIRWVVDANNHCWMDRAHGGKLSPVEPHDLLSECSELTDKNAIRALLGLKPMCPGWMQSALNEGWKPPEGWNRDDYAPFWTRGQK